MSFKDLKKEVDKGMAGDNVGVPMGFDRLNHYIGIRKSMYFLIGGLTGSGKTSLLDDAFVLNPVDWYLSKANKTNIKLEVIYHSMERSKKYKLAKWIARKIFIDHGIIIPLKKLLGWESRMSPKEYDIFLSYEEYMSDLLKVITIIEGAENPIGIAKNLKEHALKNGEIEQIDKYNRIYIPNNDKLITLIVIDHIGLLKKTRELNTKKLAIDKMSNELQYARDFYGYSPIVIQQFNRDIANPIRLKNGDVEPQLEDFKDSSQTQEDADIVLALFDPMRYKVEDPSGYNLEKLKDGFGAKYFRNARIIKNSYGEDDVRIGLAFMGQIGMFKELPKRTDMTDEEYESVIDKTYFMNN